ncbi:cilia- and flagella-associated protein 206 isoform X2 [Bacillus rossius redtenbacheri]|uniref:cilia- and flagella-associated protein 206 isoform X2 n=1 Tax=Bacillus rossius redtenbacheri TaxID=93214 RepID=UPI002FDD2B51
MYTAAQLKTVAQEVVRHCLSKGIHVTEECAEFVLKLLLSDPSSDFSSGVPINEDDLKHLMKLCVSKLTSEKDSLSLATIKMQVYFNTNYASREDAASRSREETRARASPLVKEIVETGAADCRAELEGLYRRLVMAVVLCSGLGHPASPGVLKEATAALQSVFPLSELSQFLSLGRRDRERQLAELTQVVTGIRLFNRDCQKGGDGIDDLPSVLQRALTSAHGGLEGGLRELMGRASVLTAAVDAGWRGLALTGRARVSWAEVERCRDALLLARQQEVYLRRLLADVESSQSCVEELLVGLQATLLQIHGSVRYRTAVPTVEVYPNFIKLSDIWCGLQDEMAVLTGISSVMWSLHDYAEALDGIDDALLRSMLGDELVLSDEARLQASMGALIDQAGMACPVVHPASSPDFDRICLQYQGFCPWVLAKGRGALVPANQNIGVVSWQGKYYAFSSPEAAYEFDKDPEYYVTTIAALAHFVPELINFLETDVQTLPSKTDDELKLKSAEIAKQDYGMQTELHPVPSNIDPSYSWNVWDLKRQAVHLADICNSRTRSTQTLATRGRLSIGCQARPPRDACSQTRRESCTSMPQPRSFIFGLRGRRENIQHVVSITQHLHG